MDNTEKQLLPHQERVVQEQKELQEKITKLVNFFPTATGRYQRRGEKGWETVVQKSFDADLKVNVIEELKKEIQKIT